MIQREEDVATLRQLLARKWPVPLCVIGMGARGAATRVEFAKLGSCLTYGYLDAPSAPGQPSAAELVALMRSQRNPS
jgi:3-dehydroquinate dehydratase type I